MSGGPDRIRVRGARVHNLRDVDVDVPHGRLVAVTGVSGSGKSSFAFDTLFREGERRYLGTLDAAARRLVGKLERPEIRAIDGLGPAVAVGQSARPPGPRSTVGTATGLSDLLRLLFARLGTPPRTRGELSFNDAGACPSCDGLGVTDEVDPELIVADPSRTIRGGALVPTLKSGYTVYSQVTVEVLNDVCAAHGFDVDTPWQDLTDAQRGVIFFGSDRLEVPYGKHSLESRMRWSGITAKPRETGFYRGLVPVIAETLARSRNDNILRFARTVPCGACEGARLNPEARAVRFADRAFVAAGADTIDELRAWAQGLRGADAREAAVLERVRPLLLGRADVLRRLGLGHLPLSRGADGLSSGERQRIRLAQQLEDDLAGLLYVLDEPAVDLHPAGRRDLQDILHRLVRAGNTVVTVEHDPALMRAADHLVDFGPGPGPEGGRHLYSGPPQGYAEDTPTARALARAVLVPSAVDAPGRGPLALYGARDRNLAGDAVELRLGAVNVVTGVSGAGKTTLVHGVLGPTVRAALEGRPSPSGARVEGHDGLVGVVSLDARPIGRTPRSNPATYTKVFDAIRALYASTEAARAQGFKKSRFSFNTKGGRCEACEGGGATTVGMHFLGDVAVTCAACGGRRFDSETLQVRFRDLDIAQVLALTVDEARAHFAGHEEITRGLDALHDVGLGYLGLGQSAPTLSGGEAQRVRLASELARPAPGPTLYLLDEPTKGLHPEDLGPVLRALRSLAEQGHTVVLVEHHIDVWTAADWMVDLGPGAGPDGGRVVAAGPCARIMGVAASVTGAVLRGAAAGTPEATAEPPAGGPQREDGPTRREDGPARPDAAVASTDGARPPTEVAEIRLRGVTTHNLRGVDAAFALGALTAVTGPSGSGKTSLVFDTLAAEAQHRLTARLTAHARQLVAQLPRPAFAGAEGLRPVVAIRQRAPSAQPRSTVGTLTEVQDSLRLLFSRLGEPPGRPASAFSFNTEAGACPACTGLGHVLRADPDRLVTDPGGSALHDAYAGTAIGRRLMDPTGQHPATLASAARALGLDVDVPFEALSSEARALALEGAGDRVFEVDWAFSRGKRSGTHRFEAAWPGVLALVEAERAKVTHKRAAEAADAMRRAPCPACDGDRLAPGPAAVRIGGLGLGALGRMVVPEARRALEALRADAGEPLERAVLEPILGQIVPRLDALVDLGLGHLTLGRGADTLSAGELQRVRLAAHLARPMPGVAYVLDEPTRGLHPRDVQPLLRRLRALRDAGSAVIVVEHDPATLAAADRVIRLGPGAGPEGGRILGDPTDAPDDAGLGDDPDDSGDAPADARADASLGDDPDDSGAAPEGARADATPGGAPAEPAAARVAGAAGSGSGEARPNEAAADAPIPGSGRARPSEAAARDPEIRFPAAAPSPASAEPLAVGPLHANNLQGLRLALPAGRIAVVGPSGSGKSTLLAELARRAPRGSPVTRLSQAPLHGGVTRVVLQAVGGFDALRGAFARAPEARARKLKKAAFAFTQAAGRCPACKGAGRVSVPLDFVADAHAVCEACGGARYRSEVLEARLPAEGAPGPNIAEALAMTVAEARARLEPSGDLAGALEALDALGLGHLALGRAVTTLSGGEAQRVRLAALLTAPPTTRTLFLVDEPATGLDPAGEARVAAVFTALAGAGHRVVFTSHHLDLVRGADHVIELGPGGGPDGGRVVFAGPPAALTAADTATGRAMRGATP